ncbi:MAG TPA: DUF1501 domain-containing protein [Planctomycetota bacterium]|jgi:hypothetical protein|nr:DUF1501 domain-containing protein [Planctomycetota bacterium]
MLTITGDRFPSCDGVARRNFLKIGAMGLGGLALPDLLRLEAKDGKTSSKALINVHLSGGPSHQDMWDLKPDAPSEVRGELRPIPTNVPGMEICELFPRLAKMADKFAIIRGMVGSVDEHSYSTAMTGYSQNSLKSVGGHPSIGSVVSKLSTAVSDRSLPYVSLMGHVTPGYLGPTHQPYVPDGGGKSNLRLGKINADRLKGRTDLLNELDTLRHDLESNTQMEAMDTFTHKAVEVVTSGRMGDALEVEKEDKATLKRYMGDGGSGGRMGSNRNFLMARRLIEAGVRCVAMTWGGWDTHSMNFKAMRDQLPALDMGLSALITDLVDRGMLDDVSIVLWGEFGRTPIINKDAGRDHWPRVAAAFLAGGGIRSGQVVGSSDRKAGEAVTPVHLHQVHATLYRNLGIDLETTQFVDPSGRPQYLLDNREPIKELL